LLVANRGRDPKLKLLDNRREVPLQWALMLCEQMQEICEILDSGNTDIPYTCALHQQIEKIRSPELTASARMLTVMRAQKMSITELVLQKSQDYTRYFRNAALDAAIKRNFDLQVEASLAQQKQLEATDEISFDQYLSNYFSQGVSSSIVHSRSCTCFRSCTLLRNLPTISKLCLTQAPAVAMLRPFPVTR
jgi:glutamate--cysteine ligase